MWPNTQENADLITFTEEILNGKLHFSAVQNKMKSSKYEKKFNNFVYFAFLFINGLENLLHF